MTSARQAGEWEWHCLVYVPIGVDGEEWGKFLHTKSKVCLSNHSSELVSVLVQSLQDADKAKHL